MRSKEIPATWPGRNVLVVGLGRSGAGAARALAKRGALVTVTDTRGAADLPEASALQALGVSLLLGGHEARSFTGAECIVLSPGVPPDLPVLEQARGAGVPILGELELAYRLHPELFWIAITGTCGKTTTTLWTFEMFKASRVPCVVAGNMGSALTDALEALPAATPVVAEVSSFQLETVSAFHPRVAAVLNLSEDHLDRYPSLDAYAAAKARIFERHTDGDVSILHADDPGLAPLRERPAGTQRLFAAHRGGRPLAGWSEFGTLWARLEPDGPAAELAGVGHLRLSGTHAVENALAASLLALSSGATLEGVRAALKSFAGVPHRLELVGELAGIRFVNDSQATKLASVRMALLSYPKVWLIAGGRDKGAPFERIRDLVHERTRGVILLGEAQERLERAWNGVARTERAASLEEAVERAASRAEAGDTVLLSPGCASFDQFRDYQERGDRFRQAARSWIARQPSSAR